MKSQAGPMLAVDRIEGPYAVLLPQSGEPEAIRYPLSLLPAKVKEGDILCASFRIDVEATRQAKEEAARLLRELTGQ